uniref:Secreted protein n=1 Tax=Mesocestoides corti TaxID=53468 RepID=A0A5K3F049_MESCO
WLSALSHSSRPVRRICLASLVANAGGVSQHRQGLMQLSRLVVRALHANRSPDVGPVTSEGDACAAPSSVQLLLLKFFFNSTATRQLFSSELSSVNIKLSLTCH